MVCLCWWLYDDFTQIQATNYSASSFPSAPPTWGYRHTDCRPGQCVLPHCQALRKSLSEVPSPPFSLHKEDFKSNTHGWEWWLSSCSLASSGLEFDFQHSHPVNTLFLASRGNWGTRARTHKSLIYSPMQSTSQLSTSILVRTLNFKHLSGGMYSLSMQNPLYWPLEYEKWALLALFSIFGNKIVSFQSKLLTCTQTDLGQTPHGIAHTSQTSLELMPCHPEHSHNLKIWDVGKADQWWGLKTLCHQQTLFSKQTVGIPLLTPALRLQAAVARAGSSLCGF